MFYKNCKLVTKDQVLENASFEVVDGVISAINPKDVPADAVDLNGNIVMPGFVDIHIHGSNNIDFMDAKVDEYKTIANALYSEGVTSFLATTLTSDTASLTKVCETVKEAKKENPSLAGIHLEGPYINAKYKGAQNEAFIRNPDLNELKMLQEKSGNNIRYIAMAPEKEGAIDFIKGARKIGVVCSAGHSDASFDQVEEAIKAGLTNTTHTHNAMSPHHHRNPGIVTAAMYFNELFTEVICDGVHVCKNTLRAFYKIVGQDRFVMITDALKIKHADTNEFELFGLPCVRKDGAAYLTSGPLAGSLLTMDQGIRNLRDWLGLSLIELAKVSSTNAAKSIGLEKIGEIKVGNYADFVVLDDKLEVVNTFKNGKKVF